jgi:hypothetical protein
VTLRELLAAGTLGRTQLAPEVVAHLRACNACHALWTTAEADQSEDEADEALDRIVGDYFAWRVARFREMQEAPVRGALARAGGASRARGSGGTLPHIARWLLDRERALALYLDCFRDREGYSVTAELRVLKEDADAAPTPAERYPGRWAIDARIDEKQLEGGFNEVGVWEAQRRLKPDELERVSVAFRPEPTAGPVRLYSDEEIAGFLEEDRITPETAERVRALRRGGLI